MRKRLGANLEEVQAMLDPVSDFALPCYANGVGGRGYFHFSSNCLLIGRGRVLAVHGNSADIVMKGDIIINIISHK